MQLKIAWGAGHIVGDRRVELRVPERIRVRRWDRSGGAGNEGERRDVGPFTNRPSRTESAGEIAIKGEVLRADLSEAGGREREARGGGDQAGEDELGGCSATSRAGGLDWALFFHVLIFGVLSHPNG